MNAPKPPAPHKRSFYTKSAAAFRWIHIYVSMLGFGTLMFFAFTGLTLNHPTWFGGAEQTLRDEAGDLPPEMLRSPKANPSDDSESVDKLQIAEWLRSTHHLRGKVMEFEVDEYECMVVFKGPGYSADVFIDRKTAKYTLTETTSGAMAVLNDLHKGRDSGPEWSWVIDISAIVTMLLSLSGFGLLLYLRRRRFNGVVTAFVGTIVLIVVWAIWVP